MISKRYLSLFALSLATSTICPSMARAVDVHYSDLLANILTLEQPQATQPQPLQLVSYEQAMIADSAVQPAAYSSGGRSSVGGVCFTFYAGYETTFLRPFFSNITLGPRFDDEFGFGYRFTLGTEANTGLGVRFRYWFYNHGHAFEPPAPATLNLDLDVADIEFTLRERMRNWDLLVSGGLRYGRLAYNLGPSTVFFEGAGPTVSLEAIRDIGQRGLYLVGNFRPSVLIGDIPNPAGILGGPPEIFDEVMTVLDSQLGVGWALGMGAGDLHLRAVWETQYWINDTFADPFVGIGSNLALAGPSVTTEFRF